MYQRYEGIGNLVRDPETRYAQSGTEICYFTVACDHGYGDNKFTEFVRCVAFGKLAGVVGKYCVKGKPVFFAGANKTRKWQDKSGNDRYSTECLVNEIKLLGSAPGKPDSSPKPDDPDDIPF